MKNLKWLMTLMLMPSMVMAEVDASNDLNEFGTPVFNENPIGITEMMQGLAGLVLVLLVIFALAWVARRYGKFNRTAKGHLHIVDVLSLGQRERIVILKAGGAQLVLGITPGSIRMLHVLDENQVVGDTAAMVGEVTGGAGDKGKSLSFAEQFRQVLTKRGGS